MTSPILWQNDTKTVTLIDLPRSIAAAQGTVQHPCHDELLSAPAIEAPFTTNEPKTAAKKAKLADAFGDHEVHERYTVVLQKSLDELKSAYGGHWCLPRTFIETSGPKRKRQEDGLAAVVDEGGMSQPSGDTDVTAILADGLNHNNHYCTLADRAKQDDDPLPPPALPDDKLVSSSSQADQLKIRMRMASEPETVYRIPPRASFSVRDCHYSKDFRTAIRAQAEHEDSRKDFDFILLDPPWPNRSVRRTHKTPGSTYGTASTLDDVEDLLFGMDLDMLMAEDCLVGIWITNKPAVRNMVLGENGLFASWGVELCEEWVWLKTTVPGEPVTAIDATWRKPYEVLLLGRKQRGGAEVLPVQTKVIIGVPDLHSRKPCIRELIEPLTPDRDSYRALEVFARYLVAGWWSWGNECIKFNGIEHWRSGEPTHPVIEQQDTMYENTT